MSVVDKFSAEVASDVKDESSRFGSVIITLMVISIVVNIIRLMMSCNLFGKPLEARIKNPGPLDRILLKKAVRDGLTKDQRVLQGQIYEGILSKSKKLTSEQLSAMVEEVKK
jgi:hypothetical protein